MKMECYSHIASDGVLWYYVTGPNDAVMFTQSGNPEWWDSLLKPDEVRDIMQKQSKRAIKSDVGLPIFP